MPRKHWKYPELGASVVTNIVTTTTQFADRL